MIEVRLAEKEAERRTCLRLRWTVFVEEQSVQPSLEVDEHDSSGAVHALALLDGVPAGTGRLASVAAVPSAPATAAGPSCGSSASAVPAPSVQTRWVIPA